MISGEDEEEREEEREEREAGRHGSRDWLLWKALPSEEDDISLRARFL